MNKPLIFKILYYICFIISVITWFIFSNFVDEFAITIKTTSNAIFGIINLILVIIFSLKIIKHKLSEINIMFPISYLIFLLIVVILIFIMNNKLIIPYIHLNYYMPFILFNYLLLNVYSVLSFANQKNNH